MNYAARFDLSRELRELKNLNIGGYSRRVNQSGACSSSDVIMSRGNNEDKLMWLYVGTRSCTILLRTFTKTGINLATRLELPGRSPSHDAYSCLLCSEFHMRMKSVNSKCSTVQTLLDLFASFASGVKHLKRGGRSYAL